MVTSFNRDERAVMAADEKARRAKFYVNRLHALAAEETGCAKTKTKFYSDRQQEPKETKFYGATTKIYGNGRQKMVSGDRMGTKAYGNQHQQESSITAPRQESFKTKFDDDVTIRNSSANLKENTTRTFYDSKAHYDDASPPFFTNEENSDERLRDFEMMDVTITIYNTCGIISQKEASKTPIFGKRRDLSFKGKTFDFKRSETSSGTEETSSTEHERTPMTAALSIKRNTKGADDAALETFVPSVPLQHTFISGEKLEYAASWPVEQEKYPPNDDSSKHRSSLKLVRCMKESRFASSGTKRYAHENIELQISLSRGAELIRLGSASLVISGEEEGELKMNIAVKPTEHKHVSKQKLKSKGKKANKFGYFTNDLSRRYFLDANSTVRIGLQVVPRKKVMMQSVDQRAGNNYNSNTKLKKRIDSIRERASLEHIRTPEITSRFEKRDVKEKDSKQERMYEDNRSPEKLYSRRSQSTSFTSTSFEKGNVKEEDSRQDRINQLRHRMVKTTVENMKTDDAYSNTRTNEPFTEIYVDNVKPAVRRQHQRHRKDASTSFLPVGLLCGAIPGGAVCSRTPASLYSKCNKIPMEIRHPFDDASEYRHTFGSDTFGSDTFGSTINSSVTESTGSDSELVRYEL